jgi:hypothetical protein
MEEKKKENEKIPKELMKRTEKTIEDYEKEKEATNIFKQGLTAEEAAKGMVEFCKKGIRL